MLRLAWPELSRDTVPRVNAPSVNLTWPVGAPWPGGTVATVAFKVTFWPKFGEAGTAERVVVVGWMAEMMLTVKVADPKPGDEAVIVGLPALVSP
jgi:hypothetical protein